MPARTRVRYHFTDYRCTLRKDEIYLPNGSLYHVDDWYSWRGCISGAVASSITDDVKSYPPGNPMAERSVSHTKFSNPASQNQYSVYTVPGLNGWTTKTYIRQQGYAATWSTYIGSVSLDRAPLYTTCLRSCAGDMPEDEVVNVIEFFSDLHSFSQAASLITSTASSVLALLKSMGSKYSTKRIAGILGSSSELWLQVQLVLRPLLGDLHRFTHMAQNVQRNLSNLSIRNSMKWFKVQAANSAVKSEVNGDGHTTAVTHRRDILTLRASGNYVISDSAATLQFLQAFRLLNPLSSAWEALTLSFVIDYFVDIRNRITYLENKLKNAVLPTKVGTFTLLGGCISSKYVTDVASMASISSSPAQYWIPMGKYNNSLYIREPLGNLDFSEAALNEAGLTRNRLTTLGALVITKKLR